MGGFQPHHPTNLGEERCRGRLGATAGCAAALLGRIDEGLAASAHCVGLFLVQAVEFGSQSQNLFAFVSACQGEE